MPFWPLFQETTGLPLPYEWAALAFFALSIALFVRLRRARRRVLVSCALFALSTALLLAASAVRAEGLLGDTLTQKSAVYTWLQGLGAWVMAVSAIYLGAILLFDILLAALSLRPPAILRDVAVFGLSLVALLVLLSRAGVSLTGIVATSTVVSAVIGLSMQDTLGNVIGGMALQVENSVREGDWVRIGDIEGRVREVHWRQTSIETRNFDTVYIPNSVLMKNPVTVLGRRDGKPAFHRQLVHFYVDFRHPPTLVIDVVERAIAAADLPFAAKEPPPGCVLLDFKDSYAHYCARYWLTDLAFNDPADSALRTRIFAALRREGISPSIPAQAVFLTKESRARRERKRQDALDRAFRALRGVDIFAPLSDDELTSLAPMLRHALFTKGEVITRQGAQAHWLYILTSGRAVIEVCATENGPCRRLAEVEPGGFFGEMGLLTGARRAASVIALTDCECYRLDKEAFRTVLERRPEIAKAMSPILADRRAKIVAVRDGLNEDAARLKAQATQPDLLASIKRFFLLDD
jgi:small-conductance mechanosensitive channel